MAESTTFFAPMLYLKVLAPAIDFYTNAFGAVEVWRRSNEDGSVHVAELAIDGAIFHLHEETARVSALSPEALNGNSIQLGLFVRDPHSFVARAVDAGAVEISPVTDYDDEYRQGLLCDPFGHQWVIEKKLR